MRNPMITRSRPQSVWDVMSEMDRVFEDAWRPGRSLTQELGDFRPTVDVKEAADYFLISADLPGVSKNNVKVEYADGRLTISGERSKEVKTENEHEHRVERQYGSFERSFQLPTNIAEDKIQARYEDGVLEVIVPKAEIAKPKTIAVESEKKGLFSKLLGQTKSGETKSEH